MNLFTLMAELSLDTSKFDASAKRAIAVGKQIGDAMTGVSAPSEKAASAMEEIGKAADDTASKMVQLNTKAVKTISALNKNVVGLGDGLKDLPESFDSLKSVWENLQSQGGMTVDQVRETISTIDSGISAAMGNASELAKNDDLLKLVENLQKYRNELEKIISTQEKAAKTSQKGGGTASQSGGLFGTITKALLTKEAITKAANVAFNFGKESVEAAADVATAGTAYKQAMGDLSSGFEQLKVNIGTELLPTVTKVANAINSLFPQKTAADQYKEFLSGVSSGLSSDLAALKANKEASDGYIANLSALEKKSFLTNAEQEEYQANIKGLVTAMPELNQYIDEQTGKLTVNAAALKASAEAAYQMAESQLKANAKASIYADVAQKTADSYMAESEAAVAWRQWQDAEAAYLEHKKQTLRELGITESEYDRQLNHSNKERWANLRKESQNLETLNQRQLAMNKTRDDARTAMETAIAAQDEAIAKLEEESIAAQNAADGYSRSLSKAGQSTKDYIDRVLDATEQVTAARKAVTDYADEIKGNLTQSLKSVYDGYSKLNKVRPISAKKQAQNIAEQLKQAEEYQANLQALQEMGIGDELLASIVSDSSSGAARAAGLVKGKPEDISAMSEQYAALQTTLSGLAKTMAEPILSMDEQYQGLSNTAQSLQEQFTGLMETGSLSLSGLWENLKEAEPAFQIVEDALTGLDKKTASPEITVVDKASAVIQSISQMLAGLGGINASVTLTSGLPGPSNLNNRYASSRAVGIDYVPYDGFLASLHEGESILTKAENRQRMSQRQGSASAEPINQNFYFYGNTKNPYETAQEIRTAMETMRWMG